MFHLRVRLAAAGEVAPLSPLSWSWGEVGKGAVRFYALSDVKHFSLH